MKLGARDVGAYLKTPARDHVSALIYGPDAGAVGERVKQLAQAIVPDLSDPFNVKELSGAQLKDDPALLMDEMSAYSMLGGRRLILLRDVPDALGKLVAEALELPDPQAFLIVAGDELTPRSSLRQLYEKHPKAAAIACYKDEERDVVQLVQQAFREKGIQADPDVVPYLARSLGNDRRVTLNEIEKIFLYLGDEKKLTLEVAMDLVANNQEAGLDELCSAVAGGELAKLDRLLDMLMRDNVQPVAMLRSVQGYFQRLYAVQGKLASGEPLERVMMSLRPPVFFKHQAAFGRHVKQWSEMRIAQALHFLLQTEKSLKTSVAAPALLCSNALARIALRAG